MTVAILFTFHKLLCMSIRNILSRSCTLTADLYGMVDAAYLRRVYETARRTTRYNSHTIDVSFTRIQIAERSSHVSLLIATCSRLQATLAYLWFTPMSAE